MPKKVTEEVKETVVENNEPVILRGRAALKDTCDALGIKLAKNPQAKKSLVCDTRSVRYNKTVAKRRAKEKARRKHNAKLRAARGK